MEGIKAQEQDPAVHELGFLDRLSILVDQQWQWRENQALSRRLKNAKLRAACVEDIDYVLDEPQSHCLVVTDNDTRVVAVAGRTTVEPLVKSYLKAVKAKDQAHDLSRRLFDTLLAPVYKRGARQLIIVRDGSLHLYHLTL